MQKYEMLIITDAALPDEGRDAILKRLEDIVTGSFSGNIISDDRWGVRKLQYPIKFKTEGFYTCVTFEADENGSVKELYRVAGLIAEVLRVMITKKS
ncbi:MAG: 30S ribosomal protein S6 [Clostridia bacterium]|nr:30S ribosomal protein S6 [Clostridia bacterium]